MKDFLILKLDEDDLIGLGLGEDGLLKETSDGSNMLIQKIVLALKQEPGASFFEPNGYSIKSILNSKLSDKNIEDMKLKVYLVIDKLKKDIIAEQEYITTDNYEYLLEDIVISDMRINKENTTINIDLIVFDKAGGKTYLKV